MDTDLFGCIKPITKYAPRAKLTTKLKPSIGNNSYLSTNRKYCERFDKNNKSQMNKIVDYIPTYRIGNKRNAHFGFVTFKE